MVTNPTATVTQCTGIIFFRSPFKLIISGSNIINRVLTTFNSTLLTIHQVIIAIKTKLSIFNFAENFLQKDNIVSTHHLMFLIKKDTFQKVYVV